LTPTAFTFFSGAGGACTGLSQAGFTIVGGNEYDPLIAAIWRANHDAPLDTRSILDIDPATLPDADLYWFSPPCPEFSVAKIGRTGCTDNEDTSIAKKIAKIITAKKPRFIAIENVEGYAQSKSLEIIHAALKQCGYIFRQDILNAADFGTPQTRSRLILRAELGAIQKRLVPTHSKDANLDQQTLFGHQYLPWVGWYDAIADLFPSMKLTHLTDRQIEQIKIKKILPAGILVDGKANKNGTTITIRDDSDPAYTVTASSAKQLSRVVLVQRLGYSMKRRNHVRKSHEPVWTITASASSDGKKNKNGVPSWRSIATVAIGGDTELIALAVDRRCLARFQGFPDDYRWGQHESINCRAIGNAVATQVAKAVGKSFLE
jgi:DNA-cytosine methyltransferase